MSTQTHYCPGCRCYFGGDKHECWETLRAKAADAKAIAVNVMAENARLRAALEEALDLADEGWSYASRHFQEKWRCDERIEKLRTRPTSPTDVDACPHEDGSDPDEPDDRGFVCAVCETRDANGGS